MKKGRLFEYLELESVEFQDQYIVGGRSRSSHSCFRYHDEILSICRRNRLGFVAISFVALVVLVPIASLMKNEEVEEVEVPWKAQTQSPNSGDISSLKNEDTTTAYNALNLFEEGRWPPVYCNYHCCGGGLQLDPFSMPFELIQVDRSVCEDDFEDYRNIFGEDIRNSEILRCYNWTHRYCVPDIKKDVPDNKEDKHKYSSVDCAYEFADHDGSLYSISGSRMPESFKAKCQETLQWRYAYQFSPETGCGADVPLRFCNCNGTMNMDYLTGDGPFNCREFGIAHLYQLGSEDDDAMDRYCKDERQCP